MTRSGTWRNLGNRAARRLPLRYHWLLAIAFNRRISYSQLGEDIWLFNHYLNQELSDAVIVEIGAYAGEQYSNSLMLEELTGGHVVLIEPAKEALQCCRKARPKANVYWCAIARKFGVLELLGQSAVAGISSEINEDYIQEWNLAEAPRQQVVSLPFWALARIEHLTYVDVLSIDVQGSELSVLEGMDWSLPVGCVVIELENQDTSRDNQCRDILRKRGYSFRCRLGVSEIWTDPLYFRADLLFRNDQVAHENRFLTPYLEPVWEKLILDSLFPSRVSTS